DEGWEGGGGSGGYELGPPRPLEGGRWFTAGLFCSRRRRECRGTLSHGTADDLLRGSDWYPGAWLGRPGAAACDCGGDGCRIFERGQAMAAARSLLPVRLFLWRARCL